jgi:integrase
MSLPEESEVTLAAFMHSKWAAGLSRGTVCETIPAAVFNKFKFSEHEPSKGPLVRAVKKAIGKRTQPPKGKKPFSPELFRVMMGTLLKEINFVKARDGCILAFCFAGLLRESEAMRLEARDVTEVDVEGEPGLKVLIRRSKTDQENTGATVFMAGDLKGVGCPVSWFRAYSMLRPQGARAFFCKLTGEPLSVKTPNFIVKRILKELGVCALEYGSHSLRKGGATAAIEAGMSVPALKAHGRWKSDAVYTYIVLPESALMAVSRAILAGKGTEVA